MADQIRLVTIKRGYDPRQFSLVVLGGAGPVHGAALAAEMGMAEVLVPEAPGVLAAFGLLAAAIEHHHARTLQARTDVGRPRRRQPLPGASSTPPGAARMREEGVPADAGARRVRRRHALRRPGVRAGGADRGAGHARADAGDPGRLPRASTSASTATPARSQPVEFVNFRAVHTCPLPRPRVRRPTRATGTLADARLGERRAYFAPAASCRRRSTSGPACRSARAWPGRPSSSRATPPP